MFPEVDPVLGPEMRSTGEVLGLSPYYGEAFYKAQEATQTQLPLRGTVLISVNSKDKPEVIEIAQLFKEAGFEILATSGSCSCNCGHIGDSALNCSFPKIAVIMYAILADGRVYN